MKQHITVEQVKELSQETIGKIDDQLYSAMYFYSKLEHEPRWDFAANLLTIGKMIEMLWDKMYYVSFDTNNVVCLYNSQECEMCFDGLNELADALWEAVKYVLGDE